MKCNIIGAGRLGKAIALALHATGQVSIQALCNSNLASAERACVAIGAGNPVATVQQLPAADLTWIACSDDSIADVVRSLLENSALKSGSVVVHSSGVLDSTVLAPLQDRGCFIASLHPLKAFAADFLDEHAFQLVHCVLEGDIQACLYLTDLFEDLGAKLIRIRPESKALYHAAAVMASNYLITLAACSEALFKQAGIEANQTQNMILSLMQSNLNNINAKNAIAASLTGPLARGDMQTIERHLAAISDPLISALYKTAGLATLPLTQLSEENKKGLMALLQA